MVTYITFPLYQLGQYFPLGTEDSASHIDSQCSLQTIFEPFSSFKLISLMGQFFKTSLNEFYSVAARFAEATKTFHMDCTGT